MGIYNHRMETAAVRCGRQKSPLGAMPKILVVEDDLALVSYVDWRLTNLEQRFDEFDNGNGH